MLTVLNWVPRGRANPQPEVIKYEGEPEHDVGNEQMAVEEDETTQASKQLSATDIDKIYNLDTYDEEDTETFVSSEGLTYYKNPKDDPYVNMDSDNEEDEELDDFLIRPDDHVILSAVTEKDNVSHLDVCILPDAPDSDIYVHHDYVLCAFPLSLAWLPPHIAAVGTFDPDIELWDLNVVNCMEPLAVLSGHTDAVIGMSAHPTTSQILATCSADKSIKLWDINTKSNIQTINIHNDKVQCVDWNPIESSVLASGGFDKTVCLADVRQPDTAHKIALSADVESLLWLKSSDGSYSQILISDETGSVRCYDILSGKFMWTLDAHTNSPCGSMSVQYNNDGSMILATTSPEKESPLKLWTIENNRPSCVYSKSSIYGTLFTAKFAPEKPYTLIAGGINALPFLFDTLTIDAIGKRFGQ